MDPTTILSVAASLFLLVLTYTMWRRLQLEESVITMGKYVVLGVSAAVAYGIAMDAVDKHTSRIVQDQREARRVN